MPARLISVLSGIGLDIRETVVLGTLLKEGVLSAAQVAKATRMKRSTSYDTLRELARKGLVNEVRDGAVLRFQAVDPDLLPNYVSRQRHELEKRERELTTVLNDLRAMKQEGGDRPRVEVFEVESIPEAGEPFRHISAVLPASASRGTDISVGDTRVMVTKTLGGRKIAVSIDDADIARLFREIVDALERKD